MYPWSAELGDLGPAKAGLQLAQPTHGPRFMTSPIAWPRFVEIVRAHQRFLLVCHVRPDCDALGSELAMAGILAKLGKDVLPVNDFAIPPTLTFLDPQNQVKQLGKDVSPEQLADREVIIVLDTTAWIQLGKMADVIRQSKAIKAVLDHHVSGDDLGAELFKNTSCRGHRPAGRRSGRRLGRAADAGDRPTGLCRAGHRHRLVPLRLDLGRHVAAGRALGRCRRADPICSTSSFTNTTAWPACSLSDARWPGPARSLAAA